MDNLIKLRTGSFNFGGIHCTKFECILKATLMPTNRTRGARGGLKLPRTLRFRCDARQCASDTLADSRVQKPKNFLAFFSRLLPPPLRREAEKEMERKFLVLLRRFSLRKEQSYFNIFVCSFLHSHGDRGASSPRSVVTLNSVASFTGRGNSKNMDCARHKQIYFKSRYKNALAIK